jgi:hypothetical protein
VTRLKVLKKHAQGVFERIPGLLAYAEDTQQANPETGDKPITILLIIISGFGFS